MQEPTKILEEKVQLKEPSAVKEKKSSEIVLPQESVKQEQVQPAAIQEPVKKDEQLKVAETVAEVVKEQVLPEAKSAVIPAAVPEKKVYNKINLFK